MEDKEILVKITVDNEAAKKSVTEQTRKIDLLKKSNDKLKKTNKDLSTQGSVTAKERSKNNEEITRNNLKISEANKIRKRAIQTEKAESGSLTDLRNKLAKLTDSRNKNLQVGSEAFNKTNSEIKELSKTIKGAEEDGDDFRRSVGKYPGSLKEAAAAMGGLGNSTEGAAGAVDGLGQVVKLSPIGVIVSLLVGMVSAFAQTEEGAKKLKIIMAFLNSIFKDFVSLLAEGGKVIISFFEDPLKSIKDFGDGLVNFVQRRITDLLDGLGFLGDAIKQLFAGDFEAAAESAKKGALNLTTALIPVAGVIKDLAPKVKTYTKTLIDNANKTVDLTEKNYKLERSLLDVGKQVLKLQGQEEILSRSAEDVTKSFSEQETAQKQLEKIQNQRFALQQKAITDQIESTKIELSLAKSRGEQTFEIEKKLNEQQKELITSRNEQRNTEAENLQISAQRNQDIFEQELDFIIDVGEKRRVRYEKQATDENLSLEERTEGLKKYNESLNLFLSSQRESFEDEGLSEEEFNRLLGITDPAKLAQAITANEQLSEIQKNRLKEVFIEFENSKHEKADVEKEFSDLNVQILEDEIKRKNKIDEEAKKKTKKDIEDEKKLRINAAKSYLTILGSVFSLASDLAGDNFEVQKAFAYGQSVINTAQGVTQALAQGGPLGIVTGGIVAAAGAVELATISKTKPQSSGAGGGGASSISAPTSGGGTSQSVADTSNADQAQAQNEALEAGIARLGLTVSVTEITEAQIAVTEAENVSTI